MHWLWSLALCLCAPKPSDLEDRSGTVLMILETACLEAEVDISLRYPSHLFPTLYIHDYTFSKAKS